MNCPKCSEHVAIKNYKLIEDTALCGACNHSFSISDAILNRKKRAFDINKPPKGIWIKQEMRGVKVGATAFSYIVFFILPFTVLWSSITVGFTFVEQINSGKFNLLITLFSLPFLIAAIGLILAILYFFNGKTEMNINPYDLTIKSTFLGFSRSKNMTWKNIESIEETVIRNGNKQSKSIRIRKKDGDHYKFGQFLPEKKQYFLYEFLKEFHQKVEEHKDKIL